MVRAVSRSGQGPIHAQGEGSIFQLALNYSREIEMLMSAGPGLDTLAAGMKTLADVTRLRILDALLDGERCNCELGGSVGLPANLVSHHLRVLERAGLVSARRDVEDARWVHYSVISPALTALLVMLQNRFDPGRRAPVPQRRAAASCRPGRKAG
jgi:ArsR family transcriptional regulator